MSIDLLSIKEAVQSNCHIADSHAASDYTLCIYLLKMRELYRWESGYDFGDALPGKEVGVWVKSREKLWDSLSETDYSPIPINDQLFHPFDSESINAILKPQRLVYSGGIGHSTKAHFFLGVLERYEKHPDFEIIVVADEYARDMTAPPAMSQGRTIYVRREAMRRLVWEKYEQWLWNRPDNAMKRALEFYDFDNDLDHSLTAMTDNELENAVLHEIGEVRAYEVLGTDWERLLASLSYSKLELLVRSIRDHLADCITTLPDLIDRENEASLHFYIGNLGYLRKDLFPALLDAYDYWLKTGNLVKLSDCVRKGQSHWQTVCLEVLKCWKQNPDLPHQQLINLIENNRL